MSVKLTDRASVPQVVAAMTTEEKCALVSGGGDPRMTLEQLTINLC